MKKRVSACLAVLMALLPNTVLAAEEIPLRQTIFGTERVVAYWVLGICSGSVFDAGVHLERQAQARPAECEPDDGARGARKDT